MVLVLVVLAAVVAVSTSAGGLGGARRTGTAAPSELLWRVIPGGLIGALIGAAVLALLHNVAASQPSLARSLYGEIWKSPGDRTGSLRVTAPASWARALRRGIPLLLLLAAVGALIGASTAPLHAKTSLPPPSKSASQAEDGRPAEQVRGRYVDTDGDGKRELQIDADGDGRYESTYVFCPGSKLPSEAPGPNVSLPAGQQPGTVRIPIDEGCDGTIERYVDVRLDRDGTVPTVTGRNAQNSSPTIVPPSQANKVPIPPIIGRLLLALLAIAITVAVVVGILKRKQKPDTVDKPEDDASDTPNTASTAVAMSVERSQTELIADDDPRRAIILAYETLLNGLGAIGLPRQPQEAPEEYLRRSLSGVPVDHRPFLELTRLFGVARFSTHAITEVHRQAAQQALAAAAASLPNVPQGVR